MTVAPRWTAFAGHRRLAAGTPEEVALAVRRAADAGAPAAVLVFDDRTGEQLDLDLRGSDGELVARVAAVAAALHPGHAPEDDGAAPADAPRGRGRPRLGVVAREVTLLPRHWEWLAAQSGGASVALRRLVEDARRASTPRDEARRARDAAYRVMHALAGDLPDFEEASRALFAGDEPRFRERVAAWPADVREHLVGMAFG